MGEYLPRFVKAGYDLKFIVKNGLTDEDMQYLQIPRDDFAKYRKVLEKYEINKFYNEEDDEDDEDGEEGSGEGSDEDEGDDEEEDEDED